METEIKPALTFNHITELMHHLGLASPSYPLIALVDYDQQNIDLSSAGLRFCLDFYKISFRNDFAGLVPYGDGTYDFKSGGLAFLSPRQLVEMSGNADDFKGFALYFHPDLLSEYPLANRIRQFGFFSYSVSEALFLSEKEKEVVTLLFHAIATELDGHPDQLSHDVLVSQIELLLNHSNRFYNRQFLTRKEKHHDLIDQMNNYLTDRFHSGDLLAGGIPAPHLVALQLQVSQRYLSDMLKSLTGMNTQQHIHAWLVERAKMLMGQNTLTTAEIAYHLGFEHPQSFNRFFKQKTQLTPSAYKRQLREG